MTVLLFCFVKIEYHTTQICPHLQKPLRNTPVLSLASIQVPLITGPKAWDDLSWFCDNWNDYWRSVQAVPPHSTPRVPQAAGWGELPARHSCGAWWVQASGRVTCKYCGVGRGWVWWRCRLSILSVNSRYQFMNLHHLLKAKIQAMQFVHVAIGPCYMPCTVLTLCIALIGPC